MEHLSLAQLLKQSAMQTCYKRKNKVVQPATEAQIAGNEMAHAKSESKFIEMRGTYEDEDRLIHYAFDEVKVNELSATLIEHKNITSGRPVEMWYFESCVLQTAVYQAFAQVNPNKHLQTATFFLQEGNPMVELELNNLYLNSELQMNDDKYKVLVMDAKKLVEFYCYKAKCTFDYTKAKAFDARYKFQEYKYLQQYLTFRPLVDKKPFRMEQHERNDSQKKG